MRRVIPFGLGFISAVVLTLVIQNVSKSFAENQYYFKLLESRIEGGKVYPGSPESALHAYAKARGGWGWMSEDGTRFGILRYTYHDEELWVYVIRSQNESEGRVFAAQSLNLTTNRIPNAESSVRWLFVEEGPMVQFVQLLSRPSAR